MELARSERGYALNRQNKTLRKMLYDLAHYQPDLFSAPSLSIFETQPNPTTTAVETSSNPNSTTSTTTNEWKTRCQTQFHILLRTQEDNISNNSTNTIKFTPYCKLVQTKSIKVQNKHTRGKSIEDVVALLWQIGEKCKQVIQFDISRASRITFQALRGLFLTKSFGTQLIIFRARKQTAINDQSLQLIASRCYQLKVIDFSQCPNVTDSGLRGLLRSTAAQMEAISLNGCTQITGTTLKNISKHCIRLNLLDISHCPKVHDVGWMACGNFTPTQNKQTHRNNRRKTTTKTNTNTNTTKPTTVVIQCLKFLNLQQLGNRTLNDDPSQHDTMHNKKRYSTSEKCVALTLQQHRHVMVLNISNNATLITNKSMQTIGTYMTSLVSLNVARNRQITDEGLRCIGQGCVKLQAINLTSLGRLTTPGIYQIIQLRSNSIKLINLNGLQGILPLALIYTLSKHLPYAKPALSFYGFTPVDDVVLKKLTHQWNFIEKAAASVLQASVRGSRDRAKVRILKKVMSHRIQMAWHRYKAKKETFVRQQEYQNERIRAKQLVEWMKIWLENKRFRTQDQKNKRLKGLLKHMKKNATIISSLYRGHYYRHHRRSPIADIMVWLKGKFERDQRAKGIHALMCLQRKHRKYSWKISDRIEALETAQRKRDCSYAVRVLQQSIRMFNAKMTLHYLWEEWNLKHWNIYQACVTIQCMVRKHQAIILKLKLRHMRREGIKRKHRAAATIQAALYRGRNGKILAYEIYCSRTIAATTIQSLIRQYQVGHWSTMSPDLLYEKWKMKSDYEIMYALQTSAQRIKKEQMKDVEGHSASDSDEDWEQVWDDAQQCHLYFSAKRNDTRKDPSSLRQWEKSFVGQKVMIYDEWEDKRWVKATIKSYNAWKNKWKVIFAGKDGDYRWIDIKERHDLFMMKKDGDNGEPEGGDWVMLRLLFPGKRDPMDL